MVNLLHTLVEDPAVDSAQKTLFADALVRLSKRSCCYPESLVLKDIEIDSTHPVITGAYSEVWKGYTRGQPVGVKKVRMMRSDLEDILKACAREAIIWSRLSHPNLLPFYGIFYLDDEHSRISLISPWMEHGHIGEYLERFPGTDRELLALDIGLGVEYLHTSIPAVIHGDLKPRNIFVTPSGTACLADFGLAYAKDPQRQTASSTQGPTHGGTLAYEAPELFDGEPVSFSADMYAFGCVLYEMFAGVRPFHDLRDGAVIKAVAQGKRPGRPAGVKDWVWRLIESCWRQEPSERPHPGDIVRELRSFTTGRAQHRHHNWDDSFGAHIRGRYSLVDHPAAFPLHTHSRT
ncbi:kinase-like protein [Leucogyrophana mollusca]|uniref:Kinase-like protein n=1 Tax=Leucogyrophana mollusca TaxID=85980 RepID=A0ACB8BMX0_9AGAM|nr:kinase-like protein [Leucogyrophana mollusca]